MLCVIYKLNCIDLAYKYLKPDVIHMHGRLGNKYKNLVFLSGNLARIHKNQNEEKYVKTYPRSTVMLYIHHSCGNVDKIIPELAEIGIDAHGTGYAL